MRETEQQHLDTGCVCIMGSPVASEISVMDYQHSQRSVKAVAVPACTMEAV